MIPSADVNVSAAAGMAKHKVVMMANIAMSVFLIIVMSLLSKSLFLIFVFIEWSSLINNLFRKVQKSQKNHRKLKIQPLICPI